MINGLTNIAGAGLGRQLDISWLRQKHINNNIANINTPGFVGTKVIAKNPSLLPLESPRVNLHLSHENHIQIKEPKMPEGVLLQRTTELSIDTEMAELAKNHTFHSILVESITRRDGMVNAVLKMPS